MRTQPTFHPDELLLLLPPSEGKEEGGRLGRRRADGQQGWHPAAGRYGRTAAIEERRQAVASALGAAHGGDARLLGLKEGDLLVRARDANTSVIGAPTLPAWERYTGVVWDHLDPASLDPAARRRVTVVSGLLGVVTGDDPVPDYRLKMSVSLPGVGKLSTFWRADVSAAIARAGRRRTVIDLLPNEHRAALDTARLAGRGWRVELVDPSGKPGGHFAKAAKGALARALLTDGSDALATWSDERFDVVVTPLG